MRSRTDSEMRTCTTSIQNAIAIEFCRGLRNTFCAEKIQEPFWTSAALQVPFSVTFFLHHFGESWVSNYLIRLHAPREPRVSRSLITLLTPTLLTTRSTYSLYWRPSTTFLLLKPILRSFGES